MDRNLSQARAHSHTHMLTHVIIQTVSHKQFRSQIFEQISDRRTWKDAHPPRPSRASRRHPGHPRGRGGGGGGHLNLCELKINFWTRWATSLPLTPVRPSPLRIMSICSGLVREAKLVPMTLDNSLNSVVRGL